MLGIGIGSRTSTGGTVIEGNTGIVFDGLVASSVGHKATCPACKKGIGLIIAVGSREVYLPAGPAARAGDYIDCDCPSGSNVLVAQGTVTVGSGQMGISLPEARASYTVSATKSEVSGRISASATHSSSQTDQVGCVPN